MKNYAFTHATCLSGKEDMDSEGDMTVVVRDGRIAEILKNGAVPADCREIDLGGCFLMPGLINLHVHLPASGKPITADSASVLAGKADHSLLLQEYIKTVVRSSVRNQLNSGVTTLRSMGEVAYTDLMIRDEINEGKFLGPRLLSCGYGVTVHGGHTEGLMGIACDTPGECAEVISEDVRRRADWIKIFVTGGVFDSTVRGEAGIVRMPFELAKASCDYAHRLGCRVAAHSESTEGVRLALKAGADTIEHGAPMDDEIIGLYKEKKASLTVTISPALPVAKLPAEKTGMYEIQKYNGQVIFDGIIKAAKQAMENEIPVGLGTDSACPYVTQYDFWRELCYFADYCDVSNTFALYTATLGNAKILGIDRETGSIETGKSADMIVTCGSPIDDLKALRNVRMVMARGHLIERPHVFHLHELDDELDENL